MSNPTTDLVRSYLKEIGRYSLLTPEQEITNARLVQQMMAIEEQRSSLALQLNREPTALEMRVGDEGESELVDILPMDGISLDEQITLELLHQDLSELLALLKPRQREVLTLRFGLSDNQQLTLSQVAKRLNLSRETIRKTEHLALSVLRSHQNKIKDYLFN